MTFDLHRLDNVELAKTGTWDAVSGTFTITTEHLNAAVEAQHDPEIGTARIKFGHQSSLNDLLAELGDGAPAYGYVEHLRVSPDGTTLIGDLAGIPDSVAPLIGRAYQQRSVEMRIDTTTPSGRKYKAVLTGLALLGASPPAVKGLADLLPLFASAAAADQHDPLKGTDVTVTLSDASPATSTTPPTAYTGAVSDMTPPPADTASGTPQTEETATMATWTPTAEQLKSLGLDENATTEDIDAAITAAAEKAAAAPADTNTAEPADIAASAKITLKDGKQVSLSEAGHLLTEQSELVATLSEQVKTFAQAEHDRTVNDLMEKSKREGRFGPKKADDLVTKFGKNIDLLRDVVSEFAPGTIPVSETGSEIAASAATEDADQALADHLRSLDKKYGTRTMGYQDQTAWVAFNDDRAITAIANAAVTGKRFVKIVGTTSSQEPRVAPAAAGDRPWGVALFSAAAGGRVTVIRRDAITVTAGAAITPGVGVISDATGRAVPVAATARDYGVAIESAATDADVIVTLSL